jgi:hypothetical protein
MLVLLVSKFERSPKMINFFKTYLKEFKDLVFIPPQDFSDITSVEATEQYHLVAGQALRCQNLFSKGYRAPIWGINRGTVRPVGYFEGMHEGFAKTYEHGRLLLGTEEYVYSRRGNVLLFGTRSSLLGTIRCGRLFRKMRLGDAHISSPNGLVCNLKIPFAIKTSHSVELPPVYGKFIFAGDRELKFLLAPSLKEYRHWVVPYKGKPALTHPGTPFIGKLYPVYLPPPDALPIIDNFLLLRDFNVNDKLLLVFAAVWAQRFMPQLQKI